MQLRRPAPRRADAHRRGVRRSRRPFHLPGHPQGRARAGARASPSRTPAPTSPASGRRAVRDGDDYVHQRPEDLDQLRPRGRLLRDARAHRPRGAQAPGHHLADRADGHAGHRRPPAARPWRAPPSSARCSSTTCASRSPTGSATRTTAGGSPMVTLSFERGTAFVADVLRVDGARARPRRAGQARHQQRRDRAGRTPGCAARSAASPPSSTRCGRSPSATSARRSAPVCVGVGGNVFKLAYSELRQRLGDLAMHLLDRASLSHRRRRRAADRAPRARPASTPCR